MEKEKREGGDKERVRKGREKKREKKTRKG